MALSRVTRQLFASLLGSLFIIQCGFSYFWMSPYLNQLELTGGQYGVTPNELTWAVSVLEIGDALTPLPAGVVANAIGRKYCALLCGPIFFLSWVLLYFGWHPSFVFAARLIQGVGIGTAFTALPMYISEMADPRLRGSLNALNHGMWVVGLLLSYSLGPFVNLKTFLLISGISCVVFTAVMSLLPESPYYLCYKGKEKEARKALEWFRGSTDVEEELKEIVLALEEETPGIKSLLVKGSARKGLLLSLFLMMSGAMMGLEAVLSYANKTFRQFFTYGEYGSIGLALILLTSSPVTFFLIDRYGRRLLLITTSIIAIVCLVIAAAFLVLEKRYDLSNFSWILLVAVVIASYFNSVGVTPTVNVVAAEIFPTKSRAIGLGLCMVAFNSSTFVSLEIYGLFQNIGLEFAYGIYAVFGLATAVFTFLFLPETKGKSFSEIQKALEKDLKFKE